MSGVTREVRVLSASGLAAGYGGHPVVTELDIEVRAGEVVALLGANGAGKTTTLRALAGSLPALAGGVNLLGRPTRAPLHRRTRAGLAYVSEERSVFADLTAAENLRVGGCSRREAVALFPELGRLMRRAGGLLSGGEQQMLSLARALGRRPKVLLADELSLGLAPLVVTRLLDAVRQAADRDALGVVLVEQHVRQALRVADRAYVLRRGRIVLQGTAAETAARLDEIEDSYLHNG